MKKGKCTSYVPPSKRSNQSYDIKKSNESRIGANGGNRAAFS
jgi:hypothetical protein